MIVLPETLWIARGYHRGVANTESKLAYMTYVEKTKTGEESAAFIKRKNNGWKWAKASVKDALDEIDFILNYTNYLENKPRTGFKIVDYATRYRTDNKLIRVEDPDGFVLEVSVENIIQLVHEATISFGVIQEPCLWGKEGSQHVLVPTTGEVYKKSLEMNTVAKEDMVSLAKIAVGDIISFDCDKQSRHVYIGKIKSTYRLFNKQATERVSSASWGAGWYGESYKANDSDKILKEVTCKDSGYKYIFVKEFVFDNLSQESLKYSYEIKGSGKCVVLGKSTADINIVFDMLTDKCWERGILNSYYAAPASRLYRDKLGIDEHRINNSAFGKNSYTGYDIIQINFNGKDYNFKG